MVKSDLTIFNYITLSAADYAHVVIVISRCEYILAQNKAASVTYLSGI